MPGQFSGYDVQAAQEQWRRLRAWEAHYRAKGCSERKARECARRKLRKVCP